MTIFAKKSSPQDKEAKTQQKTITISYSLNMDLQIFKQLLKDESRKERIFQQFAAKYRRRFETIIGTEFANERYRGIDAKYGIDIKKCFYDGFLQFVQKNLSKTQNDNCNFEDWVHDVATKKATAARHKVNKELIKELTRLGGPENWSRAYGLIVMEYDNIFNYVTFKYFADIKYKGKKSEIKTIIENLFYIYRMKSGAKGTVINKTYSGWLGVSLRNFVINSKIREEIDEEIGVDHYDITIPINFNDSDDEYDEDNISAYMMEIGINTRNQGGATSEEVPFDFSGGTSEDQEPGNPYSMDIPVLLDTVQNVEKQEASIVELPKASEDQESSVAKEIISKYLGQFKNSSYAEILRLRIVEGWSRSIIAEKLGTSKEQASNRLSRAMHRLITVALPDIRRRLKTLLKYYGHFLKDQMMREMAEDYCNDIGIDSIAIAYQQTVSDTTEMIVMAYRELDKYYRNDPFEYSKEQI